MKNKIIILTLLFTSYSSFLQAQCGTYEYENYLKKKFPGFGEALDKTREESHKSSKLLYKADDQTIYYIPVVFHILWNTPELNIHDSLIYSQIKALNEAYNHNHKDTGKVRSVFKPVVGNARIVFYLAKKDPEGKPTNGINRVKTKKSDFGDNFGQAESVKFTSEGGSDAWNPNKYLNIWVCRFTYQGYLLTAAYGFPPINAKFWNSQFYKDIDLHGVVINYQFVGVKNPYDGLSSSIREKTLVHEIGHYLGLRHIWADKNKTCNGDDDGFKDTPFCSIASSNCVANKNSCYEGSGDKPDMYENYMDYTPYPCTVMFSKEQANQMRWNLVNLRPEVGTTSIDNSIPASEFVNINPNPASSFLNVNLDKKGNYLIKITNIVGQPIVEQNFSISDNFRYKFNCETLSSGVYYIKVFYENQKALSQKFIIQ
ncbi:MAG: T9SS type A sorting domain-containing protein [Bacteroidetes bacterium]|nr:T9SS type A sorting domain-containing protein [Bacteroidota bacterium]